MVSAWIREFLDREAFHTVSYVASITWIMLSPLFVAPLVVSKLESTPDYRCNGEDKAPVHDKCFSQFKQYYEETSASFFVRFFGIINFFAIMIVFFIYSQCMKRKVPINSQGDGTLLFCAYFGQLASRFVLHIVSVVLGILLYFKNDLNIECYIKTEGSDWVHLRESNSTGEVQMYECFILQETTGFYLTLTLIVLNGVFILVAATEIIWLLIQSRGHCIKKRGVSALKPNLKFANGEVSPLLDPPDVPDYPGPLETVHQRRGSYSNPNFNEESSPLLGSDPGKQHSVLNEQNNPGPSVTVHMPAMDESIEIKMKEARFDLRKSVKYKQGDEVAMVLRNLRINQGYKLTEVNLGFTNITDQGGKYISDALKNDCCKLTQLHLDGNRIRSAGAEDLSDALKNKNCKLSLLKVGEEITDGGVEYLKSSLTNSNCKLTELHVSGDKIGDKGASHLSIALKMRIVNSLSCTFMGIK